MTRYLMITTALSTAALGLTACSGAEERAADYEMAEAASSESAQIQKMDMAEAAEGDAADATAVSGGEIPVSKPQIAYSYDYGFRLPAGEIPQAQQTHINLCNAAPKNGCRVLNMSNDGSEGEYASGMLHLEVAAPRARAFGEQLAKVIDENGGSQISSSISGEDLSKQIIDTEARLRSRVILSKRLTELLATRKGTVAELVEAERAVTQVNEEIDQARSWLKEMRGRISFSKVIVNYESGSRGSGGFFRPIREAFAGISSTLGTSIGALILITGALLPWLLVIGLGIYLRRRFKSQDRTFWGRKFDRAAPEED